ncbi:hypothetical protein [Mesorhizobium temperatum]|uniref:hypothetical protein n=1 Tax=Mesorhizobium temperatum TaxID=241416 RepID=UPI00142DE44F|nr:hypothetical protein [Mesorhizobium temperatum]
MNKQPNEQLDKFKQAARELEADDSEENFDQVLKKVAKSSPPKDDKAKKESSGA